MRLQELFHSPMRHFLPFLSNKFWLRSRRLHLEIIRCLELSERRSWTSSDVRTLKTMARKKTRAASIARTLKRTEGATRQKAFSLGVSLNSRA